ncbi:universal stress protein [Kordiimonas aestuarii]|uniref:universal stress protein n=1 Tax=Kordiimonas aestuarii TaxID=1005925 RepID=UPI0021D00E26|nr:universal stress protein [Kordiimonas aestuarii]
MTKRKELYLVAVDGSEWGNRAADHAVSLAAKTGAKVCLVTVIPWSGYQPMSVEQIAVRPLEKQEEERTAHDEILQPLLERHKDKGVTLTSEFHWGHPVKVIRDRVKADHASHVFIGRRGRSRVADLILGSVANSLAHSLGVPIVLAP